MTRTASLALAAALVAVAAAGCSSSASTATTPASVAASAAKSLPGGCAAALAALPKSPPATAQQAAADYNALGRGPATQAEKLANAVSADSVKLELDFSEHEASTEDTGQWWADAQALTKYCS